MKNKGLMINLGNKCNFSCKYCYQKKENSSINTNTVFDIENLIKNNISINFVTLIGGEPLLYKEKILLLLMRIKQQNIKRKNKIGVSIITNGSIFIEELKYFKDFIKLNVSLDGGKKSHNKFRISNKKGTYDLCVNNIIQYNNIGIKTDIHSVIKKPLLWKKSLKSMSESLKNIEYLYSFSWDMNKTNFILDLFNKIYVLFFGLKELKRLNISYVINYTNNKNKICNSVYDFLVINSDGNLYTCEVKEEDKKIGKITNYGVEITETPYVKNKKNIKNYKINFINKKLSQSLLAKISIYICQYRNKQICGSEFIVPFRDLIYNFFLNISYIKKRK